MIKKSDKLTWRKSNITIAQNGQFESTKNYFAPKVLQFYFRQLNNQVKYVKKEYGRGG
jgi:hypothetical protein